jgi:hypothetical protein
MRQTYHENQRQHKAMRVLSDALNKVLAYDREIEALGQSMNSIGAAEVILQDAIYMVEDEFMDRRENGKA